MRICDVCKDSSIRCMQPCKCGVELCIVHDGYLKHHSKSCYRHMEKLKSNIDDVLEFNFTQTHLKLLRELYVTWNNSEYGAPAIDPKRPYGNSDIEDDIRRILNSKLNYDNCYKIHRSLKNGLQVFLQHASLPEGTFMREKYSSDWKHAKI